jgi:hypothetical protein
MPIPHPTPHRPHRPTAHPPHRPPHRPAPPQPLQPRQPLWAYCSPSRDDAVRSRSKTKNFDRLTSDSSSSPRVITGSICCDDPFSAGATPVADAPPTIANDIPAAPHAGKAFLECFRFETGFVRAMGNLHIGRPSAQQVSTSRATLPYGRPVRPTRAASRCRSGQLRGVPAARLSSAGNGASAFARRRASADKSSFCPPYDSARAEHALAAAANRVRPARGGGTGRPHANPAAGAGRTPGATRVNSLP